MSDTLLTAIKSLANHPIETAKEVGSEALTKLGESAKDTVADAKSTLNDPKKRADLLVGLVQPGEMGVGEEGFKEGAEKAGESLVDTGKSLIGKAKARMGVAESPTAPAAVTEAAKPPVAAPAAPQDVIESQGLKYKGEVFNGAGVHQFEHPDYPGQTMSVPEPVTADAVNKKAASKIQAFKDNPTPLSKPRVTFEAVGGKEVAPAPEASASKVDLTPAYGETGAAVAEPPTHPDLQAVTELPGVTVHQDPSQLKDAAHFITPDGKFVRLPQGLGHPEAISKVSGGEAYDPDNRVGFIKDTGAIRTRFSTERGGDTMHISVPPQGVTEEQIPALKQAIAQAGRYGQLVMERADVTPETKDALTMKQEFPRSSDAEEYLKKIQAHPEQKVAERGLPEMSANADLQASAQKYAKSKGMPEINHEPVEVDPERAKEIAQQYDAAEHAPNDPKVKAAYDAMKSETKDQFHHLRDDLGLKFEPQEADPYKSAGEMMDDVKKNNRLKVFTGSSTGADHPLSQVDPETGQTYNTLFRWVHDAMGHAAGGNDFSEAGEKSATEAHAQMYSPAARPAMRAETEGQTSWFFHNPKVEAGAKPGEFAPQKATILPEAATAPDWHKTAGDAAAKNEAGGIDPRTGTSDSKGTGTEIMPERRQALDHAPTPEDFQKFYEQNKDVLDKYPELRVGWDNNSKVPGGHEINIGAVGKDAERVAKKLDQVSAFDIAKGEVIPTKGSGLRSEFSNYPMEDRIKDLKGENLSDTKGFEHLSKDIYDHLEPDERDYLEGNKTLQRNVMTQYHRLEPSVAETTNAMQAGAALGGWWQRYIDIFHNLASPAETEKVANTIGPSHAEVLKQWHAALSGNKSVEDANNLAWHSYADWLDAGKPTDRKSINDIVAKNGAQPEGSGKKGNAAISDTLGGTGKIKAKGLDTTKLYNLVNSPEMRGERPFGGDVFRDDAKNPLMGTTEGARKIPSMGATVAGKGNLNRLVIDAHMRDYYGRTSSGGPAAQYIADSAHLRQAAKALGLKGGEGQEQLWGTVLGLKVLLKEGLTPAEASGKLNADVINRIGKDYAEVIANDPEITQPGGVLDRLKEQHGVGRGSAGFSEQNRQAPSASASEGGPGSSQKAVDTTQLAKTAERVKGTISESKIKKPAAAESEGDTSFDFGANERQAAKKPARAGKSSKFSAMDFLKGMEKPGTK